MNLLYESVEDLINEPVLFCCSQRSCHVGAGGAPPAGETSAAQAAAQRPVLPAEASAAQEAREGSFSLLILKAEAISVHMLKQGRFFFFFLD